MRFLPFVLLAALLSTSVSARWRMLNKDELNASVQETLDHCSARHLFEITVVDELTMRISFLKKVDERTEADWRSVHCVVRNRDLEPVRVYLLRGGEGPHMVQPEQDGSTGNNSAD